MAPSSVPPTDDEIPCRPGCGACCIAPSISSPIPGMPDGKPAGVRCVQLTDDARCALFGRPERPAVCVSLRPTATMCGGSAADALRTLAALETATRPRGVGSFEPLSPGEAMRAVERAYGVVLDGTLDPYPSYVNRVYGMRGENGEALVAKFYRPGRWTRAAILDEHRFLRDLAAAEIPVIAPLPGVDGGTLQEIDLARREPDPGGARFLFALFPRTGGRTFEPESGDDLLRFGSLVGRCHAVGAAGLAPDRAVCEPSGLTSSFVDEILGDGLVHPDCRDDFERIARRTIAEIAPLFAGVRFTRIHGDCHRGNLIDRPGSGLALIDFDDMMTGPAVQDLWMVLPGYAGDCARELDLVLEGYERFTSFDRSTVRLIEPLRFMRMIYFLAWRARQRNDHWFRGSFPDWGTEAFWIKETEDLRVQAELIRKALEG